MIRGMLVNSKIDAENIMIFDIKIDSKIRFIPGQYVMLSFDAVPKHGRAFSILNYDSQNDVVRLLIKLNRDFTHKLFSSPLGTELFLTNSLGKFTLKGKKAIFIAGGIGVVPLYSMMLSMIDPYYPYYLHNQSRDKIYFYYACRFVKEMSLCDELQKTSKFYPNVLLKKYFTREETAKLKSRFDAKELLDIKDLHDYDIYICGPDKMMNELSVDLEKIGVDKSKIFMESFKF